VENEEVRVVSRGVRCTGVIEDPPLKTKGGPPAEKIKWRKATSEAEAGLAPVCFRHD
jgi:hypothetical protein